MLTIFGTEVLGGARPYRSLDHVVLECLVKRPDATGYMIFYFKGYMQLLAAWVGQVATKVWSQAGLG